MDEEFRDCEKKKFSQDLWEITTSTIQPWPRLAKTFFFLTVAVDWFNCSAIIMRLTLLFTLLVVGELRAANPDNQWVIFCNYCFTEVCHSELLRCCCSFEARDERRVTKRREGRKWGKTVEPMRSLWGPKFRYIRVITELLYQLTLIRFFKHIFPEKRNTKIKIYNK